MPAVLLEPFKDAIDVVKRNELFKPNGRGAPPQSSTNWGYELGELNELVLRDRQSDEVQTRTDSRLDQSEPFQYLENLLRASPELRLPEVKASLLTYELARALQGANPEIIPSRSDLDQHLPHLANTYKMDVADLLKAADTLRINLLANATLRDFCPDVKVLWSDGYPPVFVGKDQTDTSRIAAMFYALYTEFTPDASWILACDSTNGDGQPTRRENYITAYDHLMGFRETGIPYRGSESGAIRFNPAGKVRFSTHLDEVCPLNFDDIVDVKRSFAIGTYLNLIRLGIDPKEMFLLNGSASDLKDEAEKYKSTLRWLDEHTNPLKVFGLGHPFAHLAFAELQGMPHPFYPSQWLHLTDGTKQRDKERNDKVFPEAITMGPDAIYGRGANSVLFVDKKKAAGLARALREIPPDSDHTMCAFRFCPGFTRIFMTEESAQVFLHAGLGYRQLPNLRG